MELYSSNPRKWSPSGYNPEKSWVPADFQKSAKTTFPQKTAALP